MRGLLACLVAAAIAFGLVACGGEDSSTTAPAGDGTTAAEAPETTEEQESTPTEEAEPGDGEAEGGGSNDSDGSGAADGEQDGEGSQADGGSPEGDGGEEAEQSQPQSSQPANQGGIRGFGEEADADEREAASQVLAEYFQAREKDDWKAVCGLLTDQLVKGFEELADSNPEFKGKHCVALFTLASKKTPEPPYKSSFDGTADSFRVKGDDGFAIYAAEGAEYAVKVKREGSVWKIAYFEPRALS